MNLLEYLFTKGLIGGSGGGQSATVEISNCNLLFANGIRLELLDRIYTGNCTNFGSMFQHCGALTSIPELDTSKGTDFNHMFQYCRALTSIPKLDTSKGTDFNHMFQYCNALTSIPELDTSEGISFDSMFTGCSALTSIPELDTSKGTNFNYMFKNCSALTSIPKLDLNKCTSCSSAFINCPRLENLYLYNIRTSITIGSSTSYGHLLTVDSLVHTIKELCTSRSKRTLTMGSANLAKISSLYCRVLDDTDEKKPMELCESTDEGAMTLTEYAALKNWVLA